ncbi:thyrotropin-releasing hormone receptor [Lingula anatina]|uniref:Thyrotropin-releasing hormone receptor n=1 Tax=Lingula anatina TaxID=7574 RepID=A0A1S3H4C5_LINAN|nr:thyrotropin-releasing hormone receptor [Lingula anatina]|eukprot:XP_013380316.1 thyrotropin-releasing hormone receptor [Lingula anatina]
MTLNATYKNDQFLLDGNRTHNYEFPETTAADVLWKIMPPLLIVMGTFGNCLSLAVMTRKSMRATPIGIYLATLSVADLVVLWVGLMRHLLSSFDVADIREFSVFSCQMTKFLTYFSMDFAAYILVAVSVERYIAVCQPEKASTLCTIKRSVAVLAIIAVLIAAKTLHVFWTRGNEYQLVGNETVLVRVCGYPNESYRFFWKHVLPWIIFCVYVIGPFATMLVLNILIINGLYNLEKRRFHRNGNAPDKWGSDSRSSNGLLGSQSQSKNERARHAYTKSLTIMLLSVTIAFLVLSIPGFINRLLQSYWKRKIGDPHEKAKFELTQAVVLILNYANHSINFFLYCLTGRRFREELRNIIREIFSFLKCSN